MKKIIILILLGLFISGCSSKTVQKPNPTVQTQKQNAAKAWKELDNQ